MGSCGSVVRVWLLCLLCFVVACSKSDDKRAEKTPVETDEVVTGSMDGAAAWKAGNCTMCHGEDGAGTKNGPDLTDDVWNNCDGTASGLRGVLVSGVTKAQMGDRGWMLAMPPAPPAIADPAVIDKLVEHVRALAQ